MFASLILAATLAAVPPADRLSCPAGLALRPHSTADWFEPEPPSWFARRGPQKSRPTQRSDMVVFALRQARWFQSYAGGHQNGTWAVYDTASGAYYACAHHDTALEFQAFEVPLSWIARAVPAVRAHLWFRTAHGLTFGSTRAQVEAVYGRRRPAQWAPNALSYVKCDRLGPTCWNVVTTFYFDGDRLVGIDRVAGI